MRKVILALLAASAIAAVSTTSADASGGCGPYRHRTYWGACRPPGQWGWPPGWGGAYVVGPRWGWGWHRHYWNRHYW